LLFGRVRKIELRHRVDGERDTQKKRCYYVDDSADHRIEICDLVVQFEVSTREGFEADAIGGLDIAIGGEVRPP